MTNWPKPSVPYISSSHGRVLRRPEVERLVGLSRSSIYNLVAKGEFPAPIRIGIRAVAWRASDLDAWLASRSPTRGTEGSWHG